MNHYIVLEDSEFKLKPPFGRLVYKSKGGLPSEEKLVLREELGDDIPYPALNPIQTLFLRKFKGGNVLVSAPTSAGKSLIAYLFMASREGRKVLVAPTKSLVYEKSVELRKFFGKRVDVRTGDIIELFRTVSREVVVATYENLALALRNSLDWTEELSCVVIDEIHHLIGSRGWILEEIITYLLERGVSILGLSATLPGSEELARWIGAELFIESLWRPVPLRRQVIPLTSFEPITKDTEGRDEIMASRLLNALYSLRKTDQQVILFVHKKSIGWKILEIANREKIGIMNETLPFEKEERQEHEIAFHNADIPKEEREEIEKSFRKGKLQTLIATQTLAYGVNLPADAVLIGIRSFYDRREGRWKTIPDQLDILQMEGRAGRLGIREEGFSYLLPYGARPAVVEEEISRRMEEEFTPFLRRIVDTRNLLEMKKVLSLFILIGFLYEGVNYKKFLRKSFSLRELSDEEVVEEIYQWLCISGYIIGHKLSDKALFCIRSGMSPFNYEEFLSRKKLNLEEPVVIRPLMFVKRFDGLFQFLKAHEEIFEEDRNYIISKLSPCGHTCFEDNTDQFLFYIEGLTFKYKNIHNPPGEFSYLGTDALHLLRTLLEIKRFGDISWDYRKIMSMSHSVKYGLTYEFASLGGIKGIGHIRANLLKRLLIEEGLEAPLLGEPTEKLLDRLSYAVGTNLERRLADILLEYRYTKDKERSRREARQVVKRLEGNRKGFLVDERILRTMGGFVIGIEALRMRKRELIESLLETSYSP
jgi:helicase